MLINIQEWKDQEIVRAVSEELDRLGYTEKSDSFKEARLLLTASLLEDVKIPRLVQLTGFDEAFVAGIADRMERSKLWIAGRADTSEWEHETRGAICFIMHLMVAGGQLERTDELRNGRHVYRSLIFKGESAPSDDLCTERNEPARQ